MTRAAYGPAWSEEENWRRLELMRRVTARSLASQTLADFTWVVALDRYDPYLLERLEIIDSLLGRAVYVSAGQAVKARAASDAYQAPWPRPEGPLLTTRIDDDDAMARDFVERLRRRITVPNTAYLFPNGHRVLAGSVSEVTHLDNAWVSLLSDHGEVVYDTGHTKMRQRYAVHAVDARPAWLWVRHRDSLSGKHNETSRPVSDRDRAIYDVDWKWLASKT